MVTSPSGVRQISVSWNEIVTVSLFDVPILKDTGLGNPIVEDCGDMNVSHLVVVLVGTGADLSTSDKNVSKLSGIPLGSDRLEDVVKVFVGLDIEPSVPLAFLSSEGDCLGCCAEHCEMSIPIAWQFLLCWSNNVFVSL